jgi:hypothetical protein
MKITKLFALLIALSYFGVNHTSAQIETTAFNSDKIAKPSKTYFFTNRPIVMNEDNSVDFQNKSTIQTNTLYFCTYDFDNDSIELIYRAINLSDSLPKGSIKNNIFFEMYENQRMKRGITNFYIIVGGYGKSFEKQVNSYMRRLKTNYGDTLFDKAVILTYAWGVEDDAHQYYNAVRESENGAADFAIFQHMLKEFLYDEEFFKTHPKDLTISILFSSMGNMLFKNYIDMREAQNIPLRKVYKRIMFVGSVAPRNSFEEGETFHNLNQMANQVDVFVNRKDYLLKMSSLAHFKNRLGNKGPVKVKKLPDYINVIHLENIINLNDMSGMGHDYLLTNTILHDELMNEIFETLEE